MAQIELLNMLKEIRKTDDNWFTAKQINSFIKNNNITYNPKALYHDLYKLSAFKLIEMKGKGFWNHHKEFRGLK